MSSPAVTQLLETRHRGDRDALSLIVPVLYTDLRHAAAGCLRGPWVGRTLQRTASVHEAYALLARSRPVRCQDRVHCPGVAKRLMRQILIQHARRRGAIRRGRGEIQLSLHEDAAIEPERRPAEQAISEALVQLRRFHPRTHLAGDCPSGQRTGADCRT
jgi:hypothetical protein